MNAFFEENQHFISIKLFKEMRGLSDADRITHYERDLKQESRRRFKAHYSKSTDFRHKRNFYSDSIDYFKDFEFKFLIHSMYFEAQAEALFKELGDTIVRNLPPRYQDNFRLIELLSKRNSQDFIDNYISELFMSKLGLHITNSMSKNELSNPEANRLSQWLHKSLQFESSYNEVILILFHFTRYWSQTYSISFTRYKNYNKSVVLLTKVINSYKSLSHNSIKLNLSVCVNTVRSEVSELLPGFICTPYIDSGEAALARDKFVMTGYLVKLKEFGQVLEQNEMLFRDMSKLSLLELFQAHCSSNQEFKHLYFDAIKQRVRSGILPYVNELEYFGNYANFNVIKHSEADANLFRYIVRTNYIFIYLDRRELREEQPKQSYKVINHR